MVALILFIIGLLWFFCSLIYLQFKYPTIDWEAANFPPITLDDLIAEENGALKPERRIQMYYIREKQKKHRCTK